MKIKIFTALFMVTLGLQLGMVIQMAYASSLYSGLGAHSKTLSLLWMIAPISGLIVQPLAGYISDNSDWKWGRRIPYIAASGLLSVITLFAFPFISSLGGLSFCFLLFNIGMNICQVVSRGLIGDLTPKKQLTLMYALQIIAAGVGAIMAGFLPSVSQKLLFWQNLSFIQAWSVTETEILFAISSLVLLICILWVVFQIKESYTPISSRSIKKVFCNLLQIPSMIKQLIPLQTLAWLSFYTMWVYLPIALAQTFYHLSPQEISLTSENSRFLLAQGTHLAGTCYAFYQGISILFALTIPYLERFFKKEMLLGIAGLVGGVGLFISLIFPRLEILFLGMALLGIGNAGISSLPFVLTTQHAPPKSLGIYLGILNMTITLPQILGGLLMGFIHQNVFFNQANRTLLLAGFLLFLGGVYQLLSQRLASS